MGCRGRGEGVIEEYGTPLPDHVLDSIRRNKIALKGPLTTPIGTGFRSVNVALRKKLDLFANVRPARSLPAVKTRYEDVDIIVVRENTEDLYAGIEHMVGKDAAESIKIITRAGSERIVRFAFEYARREGRKKGHCSAQSQHHEVHRWPVPGCSTTDSQGIYGY
ncbi:MAG: isocitrate/isopropylmalate family dehydrogenase [Syntrophaceticus schinkii]